ncbi:MAG: nucleotide exchange factor GrpE [Candidatus Staskawiczbacteria bacterium]|nr:nucleotide exchange factor GrpE [Candidatus Staskawiczbacteria bacterium]
MDEEIKKDEQKSELELAQQKADEYLNNWKRERADFINYKKEEMERMAKLMQYGKEDMIEKFLPIIDNIYLAVKHVKDDGLAQIQKQIEEFLKKEGIEEIKTEGEKFNPETMEVMGEAEGGEAGMVAEELQKGYMMSGKILRPAKVRISK